MNRLFRIFQAKPAPARLNIRYYTDYPVCNYACEYCITGHGAAFAKAPKRCDAARYARIIGNITLLPFEINIRIGVDGEFFLGRGLIDGARLLSNSPNVFSVNLITNLSFPFERFQELLAGFRLEKFVLVASFHPDEVKDHEGWIGTARKMAQVLDLSAIVVAHPPLIPELERYKEWLAAAGIETFVQPFISPWNGRDFPRDYTGEERVILRRVMYSRHDYEH